MPKDDAKLLASTLNQLMSSLTNEQRLEIACLVMRGYCKECGRATEGAMCYCTYDGPS